MEGSAGELCAVAGDVGGDEQVGCVPEGVRWREGFGVHYVDGGADFFCLQGGEECVGVDDGASACVDQQGAALHFGEAVGVHEVEGFGGERGDEDDDVGSGKQVVEFADGLDSFARAAGDAEEVCSEGGEAGFDGFADGAVADDEDGHVGDFVEQYGLACAGFGAFR